MSRMLLVPVATPWLDWMILTSFEPEFVIAVPATPTPFTTVALACAVPDHTVVRSPSCRGVAPSK